MIKLVLFISSIFIFIFSVNADSYLVNGKVFDEKKLPLPFTNVILLNSTDSSIIKAALTDENGEYQLREISAGSYKVLIAQLGYEKFYSSSFDLNEKSPSINLGEISLDLSAVVLKEASVSAMKPFIEHRIDRTIVNVENSFVNAGATALEILQRSPGISIDNDGNIILRGKQGVLVMIDDKPTYLSQRDLYDFLRNMSSDQLSFIEIITNPSAKYDAAGTSGIINIKLRKKQSTGFNGRVQLSYGQGVYPDCGAGLSLNYGSEKVNIFGGYDYFNGFYFETTDITRRFTENNYTSSFLQHSYDNGHFINNFFRGGMDYFISKKHTAGFLIKGIQNVNHEKTETSTDIYNVESTSDSGYVTYNSSEGKWRNFSGNINYRFQIDTLGRELTMDADYAKYTNRSDFKFQTDHYYDGSDFTYSDFASNEQPAQINIRTFKMDYTHPVNKDLKLESGLKTSRVSTDNDVKYYNYYSSIPVLDTGKSNHFIYTENINALYINFSGNFGKWGLQAGLRVEQTIAEGIQYLNNSSFSRDYLQFFPSTFISYKINDKHQLNTSYSRRINRPDYSQLNPFKYFIDPYNYHEGNPLLEPQITNSFEFSYTYLQLFTISINYAHTYNAMTQITKQIDSIRTTFVTTENLNSYDNYGVNLNIPVKLTEWFQSSNNFNLFNNQYKGMSSVGEVDKYLTSYTFNSNNNISMPKNINAEINFWYNSEMVWGTWIVKPQYSLSAGLSRMFLKDRIQVRININDILHTEITDSKIEFQNIDATFHRIYDTQFVRFHVFYKFGKQTQRSRNRSGSSQEEQERVRTGRN